MAQGRKEIKTARVKPERTERMKREGTMRKSVRKQGDIGNARKMLV
jgi:hypothetical protein